MPVEKNTLVDIRDYRESDKNFIYASWLRGLYYGDSWFKEIPKQIFMENYHRIVEAILAIPGTAIKIACLKDDPEVILGYVIYKENRLHWIFVKSAWRKIGIAKSLMPNNATVVTHLTRLGLSLLRKHPEMQFNPFALN